MKKIPPFYPVLIGIFPILSVFSANQSFVPLSELWRPLIVGMGLSLALWLLFSLIFRSLEKGAASASILIIGVYGYKTALGFLPLDGAETSTMVGWFISMLLLSYVAARTWRWHSLGLLFSAVLVAIPAVEITWTAYRARGIRHIVAHTAGNGTSKPLTKPDIFYIILDGYGRSDVLAERYQFSNQEFIGGLKERGFYVAKDARANYCQTELSIGSSLNAEYMQAMQSKAPEVTPEDRLPLRQFLNDNFVFNRLRKEGYLITKIDTGFPATEHMNVDGAMRKDEGFSLLESTILQMTPMGMQSKFLNGQHLLRRHRILQAFDSLASLGGQSAQPRFTFVHILAPHPPFSFGPNGEPLRSKGPFGYWDASDYLKYVNTADYYTRGYAGQAEFIGKKLLVAIDGVLAKGGPKPIIIVQGDHGPKRGLDQASYAKTDPRECFPILDALLVPDVVRKELYPSMTPVNTFRTIFRTLFGDDLPNRPDRSWYSPYNFPFDFTEVTDRLK